MSPLDGIQEVVGSIPIGSTNPRWREALRPLVERDVEIAAACATSLSRFFIKHGHVFEEEGIESVCESYLDEHDLEVRFTLPGL